MPDLPANVLASKTLDYVSARVARKAPKAAPPIVPPSVDSGPSVPWQYHLGFILISGLSLLIAYSNSFGPGFDRSPGVNWTLDNKYIIDFDPRTKASTWEPALAPTPGAIPNGIQDIWTRDYWWPKGISGLYRPIVSFTYWFNWHVESGDESKIDPNLGEATRKQLNDQIVRDRLKIFHRWNLIAHWLTTVLVYFTALLLTKRFWTAAAIGILFGLHPVAVESVTNIIGRADIFAAINVFGGLLLYVRSMRSRGLWKVPWLIALGLLTFIGVFSKESAIAVIGVCALYDAIYRVPWKQMFKFPTAIQIDSVLVAVRVGLVLLVSVAFWKMTVNDMLQTITAWVPAPTMAVPVPAVPARFTWMLIFAGASFVALLAALAMIPWGRLRAWWLLPMTLPVLFDFTLIPMRIDSKFQWMFLVGVALLAATELLLQKSSDELEPPGSSLEIPGNPWRWFADHYLVFIPVLVAMWCVRGAVFDASTPPETPFLDNPIRGVNWYAGRITACHILARLWWLLIWPVRLCCDYSFNQIPIFGRWSTVGNDVAALLATLLVIAVFISAIYLWKRNRIASFFILFFYLAFLPTSNFVITIGSIMAERFMYLPLIGFVGCLVLVIEWLVKRAQKTISGQLPAPPSNPLAPPVALIVIVSVIGFLYGVRTFERNKDWRSDYTLWDSGRQVSPDSFRSYQSYAFAIFEEINLPVADRQPETKNMTIDDCIRIIEKGRPIVDQLPDRLNSSRLYLHQGMYWAMKGDAILRNVPNPTTEQLAEIRQCDLNAASALERGKLVDRAFNELNRQKEFERGKSADEIFDSGLPQLYEYLGTVETQLQRYEDALANFNYARRLGPLDPTQYLKIATLYSQWGRHEQSAIALIQLLWIEPRRTQLWNPLAQELAQANHDPQPAVVVDNGTPHLNRDCPMVESTLCSAFEGLVRIMLDAKQYDIADRAYRVAVGPSNFPQSLFDDIYKEYHRIPPGLPAPKPASTAAH